MRGAGEEGGARRPVSTRRSPPPAPPGAGSGPRLHLKGGCSAAARFFLDRSCRSPLPSARHRQPASSAGASRFPPPPSPISGTR